MTETISTEELLTHAKWVNWNKEYLGMGDSIHSWMGSRMKKDFNNLSHSDFIMKNFLKWSKNLQEIVDDCLEFDISTKDIETLIRLILKLDAHAKTENFADTSKDELLQKIENFNGEVSREFKLILESFCNFQPSSWSLSCKLFHSLVILHGESRVIEVTKQWVLNTNTKKLDIFVELVEQWDSVKELPIDWGVEMLNPNKNTIAGTDSNA